MTYSEERFHIFSSNNNNNNKMIVFIEALDRTIMVTMIGLVAQCYKTNQSQEKRFAESRTKKRILTFQLHCVDREYYRTQNKMNYLGNVKGDIPAPSTNMDRVDEGARPLYH